MTTIEPTIYPSVRPIVVTPVRDGQIIKATVRETPTPTEANSLVKISVTDL